MADLALPETPASEARENFAELTGRQIDIEFHDVERDTVVDVEQRQLRIALTKHGKPVAALVPIEDAELLEAIEDRLDLLDALDRLAEYRETGESHSHEDVFGDLD